MDAVKALAALCGAGVVAATLWRRRRRKLPPGTSGWPLVGESLDYVRDPLGFLEKKLKMHGGTCRANLLFSNVVILGVSEANARLILSKKDLGWPPHFQKVIGESSLPMVNDPMHKRIRTVNSRAFSDQQLDSYLPVLQELTAKYLANWSAGPQKPEILHPKLKRYAFECGESVILGPPKGETDRFLELFETAMAGLGCVFSFDLPGFPFHRCMQARRELVRHFSKMIDSRRQELKEVRPVTMLDAMLVSQGMNSQEELTDFCVAMMFAGHDTTLCSIQSCLHWLKQMPLLEQELRAEAKAAWDGAKAIARQTFERLPKLRAFLNEVWRITPPVVIVTRTVAEDTEVDGYVVPKGWSLYYAPAGDQSKAEKPKEFSIERHLREGRFVDLIFEAPSFQARCRKRPKATVFNSFGGGNRMCIGYKFARDEMLIFLLQFLRGYDLVLSGSERSTFPFHFWRIKGHFSALRGS